MGGLGIIPTIWLVGMVRRLGSVEHSSIMGELASDDRGTGQFSGVGSVCGRTVGGSDVRNRDVAAQELFDFWGGGGLRKGRRDRDEA